MKLTTAGINLIKRYEGLRLTAYRCPASVLTVGYGHTSAAGAPLVTEGMKITKAEADKILRNDLKKFEDGVRSSLTRTIPPAAFSACVSLAFNIGLGAWNRSTVRRVINAGKFGDAPRALQLFNKAGGKVLPGLVRRRAEEAKMMADGFKGQPEETRMQPDEPQGKPMIKSTTNIAAGVTAAAGITAATKDIVDNTASIFSAQNALILVLMAVIVGGAAWIIRERWLKSRDWAV
jgi:lysozyme